MWIAGRQQGPLACQHNSSCEHTPRGFKPHAACRARRTSETPAIPRGCRSPLECPWAGCDAACDCASQCHSNLVQSSASPGCSRSCRKCSNGHTTPIDGLLRILRSSILAYADGRAGAPGNDSWHDPCACTPSRLACASRCVWSQPHSSGELKHQKEKFPESLAFLISFKHNNNRWKV